MLEQMKLGVTIGSVYSNVKNFIAQRDKVAAERLHTNIGFGIGLAHKEDLLSISENNDQVIEPGMVFHVRITFKESNDDGDLTVAGIGDTVLIESSGDIVNLTAKIPSKVSAIMYTLDDDEEDE
jgi:nucleosome binding factor SPN SPT16 subunit